MTAAAAKTTQQPAMNRFHAAQTTKTNKQPNQNDKQTTTGDVDEAQQEKTNK